ncbi:MAG: DNA/RNA helicase domain-containing protein [Microbacterium sp.]
MTSFEVSRQPFTATAVDALAGAGERYTNWPVVYVLSDDRFVYVGETLNAAKRLRQHRDARSRNRAMTQMRIVLHDRFNKSACLDLESQLIRYFGGDGHLQVRNRNDGVTDADYFDREAYQQTFAEIFEHLRAEGLFAQSRHEIRNSDLFKLSPFKALAPEQRAAVEGILDGLFDDLESGRRSMSVVEGAAGTGKTVVAVYLLKLLRDIAEAGDGDAYETDSVFSDYFLPGYRQLAADLRVGLVIPQQSLRASVQKVFRRTPGLDRRMVMSPFELGAREDRFDLLVVDEAHRLTRRGAQAAGPLNARYRDINVALFGADDPQLTQLDWIRALSDHQIFLVDSGQSVRPADVSPDTQRALVAEAQRGHRHHRLMTQMRVKAGTDYVGYVRSVLAGGSPAPVDVGDYDLRFFESAADMRAAIARRDEEHGLGRMLAGYGYRWRSKTDPDAYDVEIGDLRMRWNIATTDWVNSPGSPDEVGSIHTIQGYDLNYAGVIVGPELFWDAAEQRIRVDRSRYFDRNGKVDLPKLGLKTTDDDLLALIVNIYVVLMTRGMLGTYVYVHDEALRDQLRPLFGGARPLGAGLDGA